MVEVVPCRCCGSSMSIVSTVAVNGYVRWCCSCCGHEHFRSPATAVGSEMYAGDSDYNADLAVAADYRALLQWAHLTATADILLEKRAEPLRVLDVGCFNGFYVRHLRELGLNAFGVDFNASAVAYGQAVYGLKGAISTRELQDLIAAGESFDVVTMFEVVEHLEDFSAVIDEACELLRPGGLLIVSVPNNRMFWRPRLDGPPHHLSRFSPESLRRLARRHCLSVVSLHEQMSLYDFLRNYVGSWFRNEAQSSMRGGSFRHPGLANFARRGLNRCKYLGNLLLTPFNAIAYKFGFRYISQVMIARADVSGRLGSSP